MIPQAIAPWLVAHVSPRVLLVLPVRLFVALTLPALLLPETTAARGGRPWP